MISLDGSITPMKVIALGANDLKERFSATAADIASGAARLARLVLASEVGPAGRAPAVLMVAPCPLGPGIRTSPFGEMFAFEVGLEKSKLLGHRYELEAKTLKVGFLDAGTIVTAHPKDSLHYGKEGHRALGLAVAAKLREMGVG